MPRRDQGRFALLLEVPKGSSALEDDEVLLAATRQLATVLGPIAEILVEKAADRAASVADLYSILSLHIDNIADRERFLSATPQATTPVIARQPLDPKQDDAGTISQGDVRRVASILAQYLGPIGDCDEARCLPRSKDLLLGELRRRIVRGRRADFVSWVS
jgi:hypothetical protein